MSLVKFNEMGDWETLEKVRYFLLILMFQKPNHFYSETNSFIRPTVRRQLKQTPVAAPYLQVPIASLDTNNRLVRIIPSQLQPAHNRYIMPDSAH